MSAVAGIWYPNGKPQAKSDCERISQALAIYGPHRQGLWDGGEIALAHRLMRFLPEDQFDRQPLSGKGGRLRLVADCRIDNREELGRALDIDPARQKTMCDAAFIMAALESWGESAVEKLCGDFAFAAWDVEAHTLLLARDPVGGRPLHYYVGQGWFAFASMPKGLLTLPSVPMGPDSERLLAWQMLRPMQGERSFYESVKRLQFGHFAIVRADCQVRQVRYWDPRRIQRRHIRGNEDAEGLREALDEATKAQLRGTSGTSLMLSGGMDSTALASSAAPLLAASGQRLQAYTNVPVSGEHLTYKPSLTTDEGPLAALLAAQYANIDHHLVHAHDADLLSVMERMINLADQPVMNPLSTAWVHEIYIRAAQQRAPIVLTGLSGNLAMSYTGQHLLTRHAAHLRWLSLWRDAKLLVSVGIHKSQGAALRAAFRPLIPHAFLSLRKHYSSASTDIPDFVTARRDNFALQDLLNGTWGRSSSLYIPSDLREWHDSMLQSRDPGPLNAAANAGYGVDRRDPTSDKRLLEFCLSLPEDRYLRNGRCKDVFRRAFAGRIPERILENQKPGTQTADWKLILLKARTDIQAELLHQSRVSACTDLIDLQGLATLVETLPDAATDDWASVQRYFLKLVRGLSTGIFTRRATGGN